MQQCDGLILIHGSGETVSKCYPGRMFEYFAVQKPVFYLGPSGVAARAIEMAGGIAVTESGWIMLETYLKEFLRKVRSGSLGVDTSFTGSFESMTIIGRFANDINQIQRV